MREHECWSAPGVLARAAFEHGVRACWVLDHSVSASQRSARALLEELATLDFSRNGVSGMAGRASDAFRVLDARRAPIISAMKEAFPDAVSLSGGHFEWRVCGERYPRLTEAAEHWGSLRSEKVSGGAAYDLLSLHGHPQSMSARDDVVWTREDRTGSQMETDLSFLARQAGAGFAAWYDAFLLLVSYHGLRHDAIAELDRAAELLDLLSQRPSD
jgi:hypothetical protein